MKKESIDGRKHVRNSIRKHARKHVRRDGGGSEERRERSLKPWLLLWSTQSLSALGSGMTSYALVLWLYMRTGSALKMALLSVCSYAPYVLTSVFAGALSDRWNKKRTMLTCDLLAALSTVAVLILARANLLRAGHLYLLNALNGLMNSVQQPASEVASTLLIPGEHYQRTGGLRALGQSLNSILTPILATALFGAAGLGGVIAFDLASFAAAFFALLLGIRIPEAAGDDSPKEGVLASARGGLRWLRWNPLILNLILFLACVNLVASVYDAALPAMLLSKPNGGEGVLALVNGFAGAATLAGSALAVLMPAPRNRTRAICAALLISLGTENFLLAFGRTPIVWCIGAVLGWLPIPCMNANMDVIFRKGIPVEMQGRVYACRNALQFFTIPLGLLLGGWLVDEVCEPLMAMRGAGGWLATLFGSGKGSGAALTFFACGVVGTAICIGFSLRLRRCKRKETPDY